MFRTVRHSNIYARNLIRRSRDDRSKEQSFREQRHMLHVHHRRDTVGIDRELAKILAGAS